MKKSIKNKNTYQPPKLKIKGKWVPKNEDPDEESS